MSTAAFCVSEGLCRGGEWVLFGPLQFFEQVIGRLDDNRLCLHVVIMQIDLKWLVPHDEFVEEFEDVGDVFVHREDGDLVAEAYFPINEERILVFAESVGYAGRTVESFVEKADLVVRHDLIRGAMEVYSGGGRQLVVETAVVRQDRAGEGYDTGVFKVRR